MGDPQSFRNMAKKKERGGGLTKFVDGVNMSLPPAAQKAARELMAEAQTLGPKSMRDPKRTANTWVQALKQWNTKQRTGMWCIPKRGSAAHAEVRAMMK